VVWIRRFRTIQLKRAVNTHQGKLIHLTHFSPTTE
jgi:hypothetical protein